MNNLGARLRQEREDLGATLDQVAEWSGLPVEEIRAVESGAKLSAVVFESLCLGLGVSPGEFYAGSQGEPRRTIAWFRSQVQAGGEGAIVSLGAKDLRLLRTADEVGQVLGYLCELLEERPLILSQRRLCPLSADEEPGRQGYRLGVEARKVLIGTSDPIAELQTFLGNLGVHVVWVALENRAIEAASLWRQGGLPLILLNESCDRARYSLARRAMLAHELCHLLHDGDEADAVARVSSSVATGNYSENVEQRARGFSPAFLAPPEATKAWWRKLAGERLPGDQMKELARYWGLSYEGAVWHAKNCRLIRSAVAESLLLEPPGGDSELAKRFEQDRAAGDETVSPFFRGLAYELAQRAVALEHISEGRKRELYSWR